jgi:hypothetical protein
VLGPPTAFADVPPEPEVYLDLLAQEEVNCLTDTGSDDTGSSISTVLGPFDQLEDETLQPPLSFQDAPLSYGDEKVLPPEPAPRKDVQGRFRSGKKRPPPPPPPRNDRPQCPLNVQTIAVVEMDRGDLPRLVDVVPKAFLETEEAPGNALPQDGPVTAGWEENRPAGADGEMTDSAAVESRAVVACGEESRQAGTENRPVDADIVPARSENKDSTVLVTEVRVEGDGKVVEMQENGFLGEAYQSIGIQNEDPTSVMLDIAEGRGSKGEKLMDRPAGAESGENRSARMDSNGNSPVGACNSINSPLKADSMDDSLLVTGNRENSSAVIGSNGNGPEVTDSQEYILEETGVKENRPVDADSNCSSPVLNGSIEEVFVLSDTEENWLSGTRDERKRPQISHIGEDKFGVTDTDGNVELRLVEKIRHLETSLKETATGMRENIHLGTSVKENGHVETDAKENGHVETDAKENIHVETGIKENRIMEISFKENRHTIAADKECDPEWTDSKGNIVLTERSVVSDIEESSDLVSKDKEMNPAMSESVDNSPALEDSAGNSSLESDRTEEMLVLTDGNENSALVMQNTENNSVMIDTVGAETDSVGAVSMEDSCVLSSDKGTNRVVTEDIPAATSREHSDSVSRSNPGNAESAVVGADRKEGLTIRRENGPVLCGTFSTRPAETEASSEGLSPKLECLEVPKDAFMVAVPQRQDLHFDSDEEDFLLDLPEMELLEQGGTVFQPATGALLTASDATFFPFRCWGPTSHLATIGEDEEEDVTNQG